MKIGDTSFKKICGIVIIEMRHMQRQGKSFEERYLWKKFWLKEILIGWRHWFEECRLFKVFLYFCCYGQACIYEFWRAEFKKEQGCNGIGMDTYIVELLFIKHIFFVNKTSLNIQFPPWILKVKIVSGQDYHNLEFRCFLIICLFISHSSRKHSFYNCNVHTGKISVVFLTFIKLITKNSDSKLRRT